MFGRIPQSEDLNVTSVENKKGFISHTLRFPSTRRIAEYRPLATTDLILIGIAVKGFYPLLSKNTHTFYSIALRALNALYFAIENFSEEYNKVIFGSIAYMLAIEADDSGVRELFPYTCCQLRELCGMDYSYNMLDQDSIRIIGEKILNKELKLSFEHLEHYFSRSIPHMEKFPPLFGPNLSANYNYVATFKNILIHRMNMVFHNFPIESLTTPLQISLAGGIIEKRPSLGYQEADEIVQNDLSTLSL